MSGNTFGTNFRIVTFGESHGKALGVVIDGIMPGLGITRADIQEQLDRRRPGQSKLTTDRKEKDRIEILSGIFEGKTTGSPIAMIVRNKDQDPSAYDNLRKRLRPGHADYTYLAKYGIRDHRGSGRASGRETIARVAAGAVAKAYLKLRGITITAYTTQIGKIKAKDRKLSIIEKNPVRTPDASAATRMKDAILKAKKDGDSLGGIIEVRCDGVPPGLGDPVFDKLSSRIAAALMSIPATKGVEIGAGFASASKKGSQNNDIWEAIDGRIATKTNNAGGLLGGISNGMPIIARMAIKPTSSISKKQRSVDTTGKKTDLLIKGRHDPCICPRVIPVAESMMAIVLADALMRQDAISGTEPSLQELRIQIDMIDTDIISLISERMKVSEKVGRIKHAKGLPITDITREEKHVTQIMRLAKKQGLPDRLVKDIITIILRGSKELQRRIK
ncbi:MAG: chorismate synthase [archaeon]